MHTDPYDAYTIQMPTMSVVQMVHGSLSRAHQIANELRNVGREKESERDRERESVRESERERENM